MTYHRRTTIPERRRGFTLVEIMITSLLMSVLAMFVASAWRGLGRPTFAAVTRARIAQEANLALESLNRDLSGYLPGDETGDKPSGQLVGRLAVGGNQLMLCFDRAPLNDTADWAAPDTVISYQLQGDQLVRNNHRDGTNFTVAENLHQMQVTEFIDGVKLDLTFRYRDITKTFTIISQDP
jgi:prepilin-type N-terminal cleavage/methylation domain-containing protein